MRVRYLLGAALLLAYFWFFVSKGLNLYFDPDDIMNMYRAWVKTPGELALANFCFWSSFFRPLGAVFYRVLLETAGFQPLPFHIVCLVIAVLNMGLCWWFAMLVSGSQRVAALVVVLFVFHSRLMEIWYRIAVVYDLLCFAFFFLALCLYIHRRQKGPLNLRSGVLVVLCYICALNSKEMAVSLPAILLAWELIFRAPAWPFREGLPAALMALLTGLYIYGKTHGEEAITAFANYRPVYTLDRFQSNWASLLNHLLFLDETLNGWACFLLLGAALAAAVIARSRTLLFAWIFLFITALPVVFLPARGAFVLYLPYPAFALFPAVALATLLDRTRLKSPLASAVSFGVVLLLFGFLNWRDQQADPARRWLYDGPAAVRRMAAQISHLQPDFPRDASILIVNDPIDDDWTSVMLLRLLYDQPQMHVKRIENTGRKFGDWSDFEYVFLYSNRTYQRIKP